MDNEHPNFEGRNRTSEGVRKTKSKGAGVLYIDSKMANSFQKLRDLSTEDLIKRYDQMAVQTAPDLAFLREEIARREAEQQTRQMLQMTRQVRSLTILITILTVVNVLAVIYEALFR